MNVFKSFILLFYYNKIKKQKGQHVHKRLKKKKAHVFTKDMPFFSPPYINLFYNFFL